MMGLLNKEAKVVNEDVIVCECGNKIHTGLMSYLDDELYESWSNTLSTTQEFECLQCGREYELTVSARKTIIFDEASVVKINDGTIDEDGNNVEASMLEGLGTGDEVSLEDGTYYHNNYEYRIENGKVESIFSTLISEGQLSMDAILFPELIGAY